jgi:hypothetical protein
MGAGREVSAAGDEGEHSDVRGWSGLANKTAQNAPARIGPDEYLRRERWSLFAYTSLDPKFGSWLTANLR